MRALAGLHRPVRGGIHFDGRDLVPLAAERIVALGLMLVPEGRQVFPELSVLDNLRLGAFLAAARIATRASRRCSQRFPRLRERLHQRAGLLSGGEQQMLAIGARADGAAAAPAARRAVARASRRRSSPNCSSARRLRDEGDDAAAGRPDGGPGAGAADRAYVIESGASSRSGTAAEIARDPALAKAYLGG